MTIRVLLADDHAVLRDALAALLADEPEVEVVASVGDGRAAVERAVALAPDVAILDVTMPQLNGLEATSQVRERCPATQVVILSMHGEPEHVHRALRAGARGYVLKSAAGTEVAAAVRAVHAGRRYLSAAVAEAALDDYGSADPGRGSLERLSGREREVLQLVVEGKSSAEAARVLHLSPKTVETYRARLMQKLGVEDLPALVRFAVRHGLTPE